MRKSLQVAFAACACCAGRCDAHGLGNSNVPDPYFEELMGIVTDEAKKQQIPPDRVPVLRAITASYLVWTFEPGKPRVLKICFGPSGKYHDEPWGTSTEVGKQVVQSVIAIAPEWVAG